MTIFTFANNVSTTLAGSVSTSATTITLSSTLNLPTSIPSGQALVITLNDAATRNNYEIVYATAITGATLTVLRAQEGTSALAWLVGDFAYNPPTAGQMGNMGQLGAANTWAQGNTFVDIATGGTIINGSSNSNGANVELIGNGSTTPKKFLRAQGGQFQILNDAYSSPVLTITDAGNATIPGTLSLSAATSNGQAMTLGQLPSQFPSSLASSGYKKIPDPNSPSGYFIEQWGSGIFPTQITSSGQNFPVAFPNTVLSFYCSLGASIALTSFTCVGGEATSNSQFRISVASNTAGSDGVYWHAKGY
jgi:hypothetical protein